MTVLIHQILIYFKSLNLPLFYLKTKVRNCFAARHIASCECDWEFQRSSTAEEALYISVSVSLSSVENTLAAEIPLLVDLWKTQAFKEMFCSPSGKVEDLLQPLLGTVCVKEKQNALVCFESVCNQSRFECNYMPSRNSSFILWLTS